MTQLRTKSFDKARIRVESVIRKQREMAGEEILEIMVCLLLERVNLIAAEKTMPADLSETVHTVVWAASRTQVDELKVVKEQLLLRYGSQLAKEQKEQKGAVGRLLNPDVEERLTSQTPSEEEKLSEFEVIAAKFEVSRGMAESGRVAGLTKCSCANAFANPAALLLSRSPLTARKSSLALASRPCLPTLLLLPHPYLESQRRQRSHPAARGSGSDSLLKVRLEKGAQPIISLYSFCLPSCCRSGWLCIL